MYYTLVLKVEYFSKYWIYHLKYLFLFWNSGDSRWRRPMNWGPETAKKFCGAFSFSLSFHKEKRHGFRYFTPPNKLRWIDLILHHIFPLGGWSVTFLPSHIIMHTHHTLTRVSNFARIVSRRLVIWLSIFLYLSLVRFGLPMIYFCLSLSWSETVKWGTIFIDLFQSSFGQYCYH